MKSMTKTKPMTESIEVEKTKIEGRNWGIKTNSEQLNIYLPLKTSFFAPVKWGR